jgi:thymidylate kinase
LTLIQLVEVFKGTKNLAEKSLIDDGCLRVAPSRLQANVARALIAALSDECKAYCLLSGYENLPDSFDTDLDFMVGQDDFQRMPRIIAEIAWRTNTRLFQSVDHEITARAFLLISRCGQDFTFVQLDAASDYRHFGSLWLRADEVLAGKRQDRGGLWIPSAAHEFAYYLVKRLNKRDFKEQHGAKLHRLYEEDSQACDQMIARFWKGQQRRALSRMASSNNWTEMFVELEAFRRTLMKNSAESFAQRVASSPKRTLHVLDRITRPTGGWIAFIGPDGAGKSLVINFVSKQFAPAFRDVSRFHLRPKLLSRKPTVDAPITNPHGRPPRGLLASAAKIFYYAADYLLGYVFQILPAMIRTRLILFDRYIYDLQADNKRVRYGGPKWLLNLAARVVPGPDLVVLLDAPAEVLRTRKQEVPFEEVARQRTAYLQIARALPSVVIVNAARPIADVSRDVAEAIIVHFSKRVGQRLGLQLFSRPTGGIETDLPSERC